MTEDGETPLSEMMVDRALLEARTRLKLTQAQLAGWMGLKLRSYQDLEAGRSKGRAAYIWALEMISLRRAADQGDTTMAGESGKRTVAQFAELVRILQGSTYKVVAQFMGRSVETVVSTPTLALDQVAAFTIQHASNVAVFGPDGQHLAVEQLLKQVESMP